MSDAIRATVDSNKLMMDLCEAMGIDPGQVTYISVEVEPDKPLLVSYTLLGRASMNEVSLPTVEQATVDAMLEEYRQAGRRLAGAEA